MALSERRVAVKVVGIEDRGHIPHRVPGESRDLSFCAADQSESRDSGAAQVVEGHADDARLRAGLAPGAAEAIGAPCNSRGSSPCRCRRRSSSAVLDAQLMHPGNRREGQSSARPGWSGSAC